MPGPPLKLLLAVTLLGLAFPAAAMARKNAWQLVSLSGTYQYHATNTAPTACDPDSVNDGDGVVLSRDFNDSFHADSFPRWQYAAKYFPAFGEPLTNATGQKAHLIRSGTVSETYRTFSVRDGMCTSQDQTCSKPQNGSTARFMFYVTPKRFRYGAPLQIHWVLNLGNSIGDCTPKGHDGLDGGLISSDIPTDFRSKADKRQFTHRRATFSIHGTARVPKTRGYTATISYSVKATVKKIVISEACADTRRQHSFVCTP